MLKYIYLEFLRHYKTVVRIPSSYGQHGHMNFNEVMYCIPEIPGVLCVGLFPRGNLVGYI